MDTESNVQNLNEGSRQAIHALIGSIAPEIQGDGKLSPDAIEKLSKKLKLLVGDDAVKEMEQSRNERGELVNEEGLPIMDISEPISTSEARTPTATLSLEADPLIPFSKLTSVAKERLRQQRERILDMLEEEERQQDRGHRELEKKEIEEILHKRKEAAGKEKEKMRAAKELQKKMGKALLRGAVAANEISKAVHLDSETSETTNSATSAKKKAVSFATSSESTTDSQESRSTAQIMDDWGDVMPARLRTNTKPFILSRMQSETLPMKMSVVERGTKTSSVPYGPDSDDESDQGMPDDDIPDGSDRPTTDQDSGDEPSQVEEIVQDEFDFDFAQHQREVALEYYRKREQIGKATSEALMSESHDDNIQEPNETLDTPISDSSKPTISRFKATRLASAYNVSTSSSSSSPSLSATIVPESSARAVQHAFRTGKLDADGHLVGGEDDSESEVENEGLQEVLNLLKKGEVYNIGPDGNYIHTIPPRGHKNVPSPSKPHAEIKSLPPSNKTKASKFKVSRSQAGRQSSNTSTLNSVSSENSASGTPISHMERSSPKLGTSERPESTEVDYDWAPHTVSNVVESPSFSMPRASTFNQSISSNAGFPSMVVDSPSFPQMVGADHGEPVPASMQPRSQRPPTVMSSTVQESTSSTAARSVNDITEKSEKKVSRFKAQRMS